MKLGQALWILAVAIAVLVGLAKFASITVPVISPLLMQDSTLSLFIALAMALLAKWV